MGVLRFRTDLEYGWIGYKIKMDNKLVISIASGTIVTFLVYLGLQYSLNLPILSRQPITSEMAISIVVKKQNLTSIDLNNFSTRYVYIEGDGNIFESNIDTNSIGKYLGKAGPTITTGNHFVWEVTNTKNGDTYYVDNVTGEIIAT